MLLILPHDQRLDRTISCHLHRCVRRARRSCDQPEGHIVPSHYRSTPMVSATFVRTSVCTSGRPRRASRSSSALSINDRCTCLLSAAIELRLPYALSKRKMSRASGCLAFSKPGGDCADGRRDRLLRAGPHGQPDGHCAQRAQLRGQSASSNWFCMCRRNPLTEATPHHLGPQTSVVGLCDCMDLFAF